MQISFGIVNTPLDSDIFPRRIFSKLDLPLPFLPIIAILSLGYIVVVKSSKQVLFLKLRLRFLRKIGLCIISFIFIYKYFIFKLIGYARVSKADGSQVLDLQIDALAKAGINQKRIYSDHASSRKDSRPGLESCLKALQPGNTLVVWKLDH